MEHPTWISILIILTIWYFTVFLSACTSSVDKMSIEEQRLLQCSSGTPLQQQPHSTNGLGLSRLLHYQSRQVLILLQI